ncbi:hypothetical protein PAXINDRAFT_19549 [Paxillus involutus ATCC 200175]|uniref:Uncharacterized protein n=1 Tax=Paxillus involutus ATCC 200175 TaxID=664439 RepID=A0A0C9T7V3_PAXIN|nr:hypothetical protein PAXINDRAFT_19549 [Paxillus involutus ATCC 200175]
MSLRFQPHVNTPTSVPNLAFAAKGSLRSSSKQNAVPVPRRKERWAAAETYALLFPLLVPMSSKVQGNMLVGRHILTSTPIEANPTELSAGSTSLHGASSFNMGNLGSQSVMAMFSQ